jgi:tetratricopeptide (TPR) repeat protein
MCFFEKGNEFYNNKNYKDAITTYLKSAEIKENEAASLYNAAVCYIKLKEYEKAIPLLKKSLILKSDNKYFFNLAYCYSMLKDTKKALIYFNTAWALDNADNECEKAIKLIIKQYK